MKYPDGRIHPAPRENLDKGKRAYIRHSSSHVIGEKKTLPGEQVLQLVCAKIDRLGAHDQTCVALPPPDMRCVVVCDTDWKGDAKINNNDATQEQLLAKAALISYAINM